MSSIPNPMGRAIELSKLGLGKTYPNPVVGAVIVAPDGQLLGEGYHQGGDHAEVVAIKDAQSRGNDLSNAILYCTLEPCNHFGKTPPCTQAIVQSGIKIVHFSLQDPHQIASGGVSTLRAAGVTTIEGEMREESAFANRAWLTKIEKDRPRVTVKIAQSLDARVAAADGQSQWITSLESRTHAKSLRDEFDAICIGTQTALSDNPTLRGLTRNPKRIVMGQRELPRLKLDDEEGYTQIKSRDFGDLLAIFRQFQFNSILIEGGPTMVSAALETDIVDEIHLYQAPIILGSGTSSVSIPTLRAFSDQLQWQMQSLTQIGSDLFAIYIK